MLQIPAEGVRESEFAARMVQYYPTFQLTTLRTGLHENFAHLHRVQFPILTAGKERACDHAHVRSLRSQDFFECVF